MSSRTDITQAIGCVKASAGKPFARVSSCFGVNIFKEETMNAMLSKRTYQAFKRWQDDGAVISRAQADEIADAMKEWALDKGANFYTHWFQPMTGQTAEKHESFISITGPGNAIEKFMGSKLIQGEPDASSFPSGGLRATFEARGYTAWDPSSPAFITEVESGKTLCIPSIFISYRGDALDKKLPLQRSHAALNRATLELLRLFGNTRTKRVYSTCGAEQEYFLVDGGFFKLRSDLQLTGRTLVGAPSPKGQQLEDQYFGSIKDRVLNYMNDVSYEACRLGIPLSIRHNEVAPHQFEFSPIFERSDIAADHNQLLMDILKRIAKRHGLECLLHEKPFSGINGSGKHLNWSIDDNNGNNLLNPGETPEDNLLFLTLIVAVVHAVHIHADLLRASVASAGNEHRLGSNEAPPAIISVFLGEQLSGILRDIKDGRLCKASKKDIVDFGLGHLPRISRDNTDRNRTSPFAYTGNKFEFRMAGSSVNIATPLCIINTIVADSIRYLTARIKSARRTCDLSKSVLSTLQQVIPECESVLYEGDNYSESWMREAARRKMANEPSTPRALKAFVNDSNIRMFENLGVFTRAELSARYNIWLDLYNKVIDIEARTLLEMVKTQILPQAYEFQNSVGEGLRILRTCRKDAPAGAVEDRRELFAGLSDDILRIRKTLSKLTAMLRKARSLDSVKRGDHFFSVIKPQLACIRHHVDNLETLMPDHMWQLPKYRELLFID